MKKFKPNTIFFLFLISLFNTINSYSQIISKSQKLNIQNSNYSHNIFLDGKLDGFNTFSYKPNSFVRKFEPMKLLEIENSGLTTVNSPRLVFNETGNWYTNQLLRNEIFKNAATDREKLLSLWNFARNNRFHSDQPEEDPSKESRDPLKLFGVYGYGICSDVASGIANLTFYSGHNSQYWKMNGHIVSESKFSNGFELIDGDIETFFLKPDNKSIASKEEVSTDRYLLMRTHNYGKAIQPDSIQNNVLASIYKDENSLFEDGYNFDFFNPYGFENGHTLDYKLRPGEKIIFDYSPGKIHHDLQPVNINTPDSLEFANGYFYNNPKVSEVAVSVLFDSTENISSKYSDNFQPDLHVSDSLKKGSFLIKVTSPFVIVDGKVSAKFTQLTNSDSVLVYFSKNGIDWNQIWTSSLTGSFSDSLNLYNLIDTKNTKACYSYYLKFIVKANSGKLSAGLDSLSIKSMFQISRFFLPRLKLGDNSINYSDQSGSRNLDINILWNESNENNPPDSNITPVFPTDESNINSLKFNFEWTIPSDFDGDEIIDYEFELSDRSDMRFPLSPNFNRYISTLHQPIQSKFEIPYDGLLNAGTTYYWRVRAKDEHGNWGNWSSIFSFTPNGIMPPVNLNYTLSNNKLIIKWNPNPNGVIPFKYEIYASDETNGFWPLEINKIDEPIQNEYVISLENKKSVKTFYRITAVDENGNKSGSSELLSLPRPFSTSKIQNVDSSGIFTYSAETAPTFTKVWRAAGFIETAFDQNTITVVKKPNWLIFNPDSNSFSGEEDSVIFKHLNYDSTLNLIELSLSNQKGKTVLQTIRLKSDFLNHAPQIKISNLVIKEDSLNQFFVTGFDSDSIYGDLTKIKIIQKPVWLSDSLSNNRIYFKGVPGRINSIDTTLRLRAFDLAGDSSDFIFNFQYVYSNQKPELSPFSDQILFKGKEYRKKIEYTDPDTLLGDHVNFTIINAPSFLQLSDENEIYGTPQFSDKGNKSFKIAVFDDGGKSDTINVNFIIYGMSEKVFKSLPVFEKKTNIGLNTVTPLTAGTAVYDINNDGLDDIINMYILINNGNGTYTNTGLVHPDAVRSHGISVTDIAKVGYADIMTSGYANRPSEYYKNNRDGTFDTIGISIGYKKRGFGEAIAVSDIDGDGHLDIFTPYYRKSVARGNIDAGNQLFIQQSNQKFYDYSDIKGNEKVRNYYGTYDPEGSQFVDFDNDGDLDLYCNGYLYENSGGGSFRTDPNNFGIPPVFDEGISFGDFNNDGFFDLWITNPGHPRLFRNNGNKTFTEITKSAGVSFYNSIDTVNWNGDAIGGSFFDINNDGYLDIVVGRGYLYQSKPYQLPDFLKSRIYINNGDETFAEVTDLVHFTDVLSSSTSYLDYDQDGDLDFINVSGMILWKNNLVNHDHSFKVRVLDENGLKTQYGTSVKIYKAGTTELVGHNFVKSTDAWIGQPQYDLHFGLNPDESYDIEINIPVVSGKEIKIDKFTNSALGNITPNLLSNRLVTVERNGHVEISGQEINPNSIITDLYAPKIKIPASEIRNVTDSIDYKILNWKYPKQSINPVEIQVSKSKSFFPLFKNITPLSDTTVSFILAQSGNYYWRIREISTENNLPWSDIGNFQVNTIFHKNRSPEFVSAVSDTIAIEDSLFTLHISAFDPDTKLFGDAVQLYSTKLPDWLTLNSNNLTISGIPSGSNVGVDTLNIYLSDNLGRTVAKQILLTVLHVNHNPKIISNPDTMIDEDSNYSYQIIAEDQDSLFGDIFSYHIISDSSWLSIDTTSGLVTGIPRGKDVGKLSVKFQVKDGKGGSAEQEKELSIIHVNHNPIIVSSPDTLGDEDSHYSYQIIAEDQDSLFGDIFSYHLVSNTSWLSIDTTSGLVSGIPRGKDVGKSVVRFQVKDGKGGTADQEKEIEILHINHNPVIISIADTLINEDSNYSYQIISMDQDSLFGDVLTYQLLFKPDWLEFKSSYGLFTGIPRGKDVGKNKIGFLVNDGKGGMAEQESEFEVVHINHNPIIVSLPDTLIDEDSNYSYQIIAEDQDSLFGDTFSYHLVSNTSWLSIDSTSGLAKGIPRGKDVGKSVVRFQVRDGKGGAADHEKEFTIIHINHNPIIVSTPDTLIDEDSNYSYQIIAEDQDSLFDDILSYHIISDSSWLLIDTTSGLATGTPRGKDVGKLSVKFQVKDGKGGSFEQEKELTIIHVNHNPIIVSLPDTLVDEDSNYSYQIIAEDQDSLFGDTFSYHLVSNPSWLSIDTTSGLATGIPRGKDVGKSVVRFQVRDGKGGFADQEKEIKILHVNHNPVILSVADTLINEDSNYSYQIISTDQDSLFGDVLTYQFLSKPDWLEFNPSNGLFAGIPHGKDVGRNKIRFRVNDGKGGSTEQESEFKVVHINHDPEINSIPSAFAYEDSLYEYLISVVDIDTLFYGKGIYLSDENKAGLKNQVRKRKNTHRVESAKKDVLKFKLLTQPGWLFINSETGYVWGVPDAKDVGDSSVVMEINDGNGGVVTQAWKIKTFHVNHKPNFTSFADSVGIEDSLYTYRYSVADQDQQYFSDKLDVTAAILPKWLRLDTLNKVLTGMVPIRPERKYKVILQVSDDSGAVSIQTFEIRTKRKTVADFIVKDNFPNPSKNYTNFVFGVPSECYVTIDIYNLLGQKIETVFNSSMDAGIHFYDWYFNLSSGTYFYHFTAKKTGSSNVTFSKIKKFVVLK